MNHIKFLEDDDLYVIRNVTQRDFRLERGHIIFWNDKPSETCELIVRLGLRYKIKAAVGPVLGTPSEVQYVPKDLIIIRKYSGSLAFGDLEGRVIEGLRKSYDAQTMDAYKYDSYSRIVGRSREDLIAIDPVTFQATAAILGTFTGIWYEPVIGASITCCGLGGSLASALLYWMERQELNAKSNEIRIIKEKIPML